ncbi:MAG TPA: PIN domain-containing protein [Cyclobacteriaceae bacterium]|nr:PIN domain-containing protein [Cyclobacteriaceae bacterium]
MMVDTSIWIDYLYYNRHPELCDYLDRYLKSDNSISCTPVIFQEVLQGVRKDSDFLRLREDFLTYRYFQFNNQLRAAEDAAAIFRKCRKNGLTIRKANDCMIALICLHYDLELLHADHDFDMISKLYPLKTVPV